MKSLLFLLGSLSVALGCLDTEVDVGGQCFKKVNLGRACKKVEQCPSGAVCSITCICPSGFLSNGPTQCLKCNKATQVLVKGVCYNKETHGRACSVKEQCKFAGGRCMGTSSSMTCQCTAGSVWNGKACAPCAPGKVIVNNACVDKATHGAACQANEQCGYRGGVCMSGKCACTAGTGWNQMNACTACSNSQVLVASQCMNKAPHGAVCSSNEQCSYEGGVCTKETCGCSGSMVFAGTKCVACEGVLQNNMCFPFAARGQICANSSQCAKTAGTQCIGFVCQCAAGTTFKNGSCTKNN